MSNQSLIGDSLNKKSFTVNVCSVSWKLHDCTAVTVAPSFFSS